MERHPGQRRGGNAAPVDLRLANLVCREGNRGLVHGTEGNDRFGFEPGTPWRVTINAVQYELDPAEVASVTFDGGMGDDTATLAGGWEE